MILGSSIRQDHDHDGPGPGPRESSDIKYGIQTPRPGGPILLLRLGILTEQGEGS